MSVEPSREEDPIEQLLLTAYPNPERNGCPGRLALEKLSAERDPKSEAWYHVRHCSPCFSEFKELRNARWKREHVRAQHMKKRAWLATAAGLALIAAGGGAIWIKEHHGVVQGPLTTEITLDLSEADTQRGADRHHTVTLPTVPRAKDMVRIILPRFSDEGEYSVAVLKSETSRIAVAMAQASTRRTGDRLVLSSTLDLSKASPGQYLLATRSGTADQIYFYPLRIQ
jgi:hypothetical protein